MSVIFTNCAECRHFEYTKDKKYICTAFPKGIPKEHMYRKNQDTNIECNNGIRYEEASK